MLVASLVDRTASKELNIEEPVEKSELTAALVVVSKANIKLFQQRQKLYEEWENFESRGGGGRG